MTLGNWIEKTGLKKVARDLDVEQATVYYWKNYQRCPRPEHLVRIEKLSKGKVTVGSIVKTFVALNY